MVKYIAIYFVVEISTSTIYLQFSTPFKVLIYNEMRVEVIDRTIIGVGDERGVVPHQSYSRSSLDSVVS